MRFETCNQANVDKNILRSIVLAINHFYLTQKSATTGNHYQTESVNT